MNILYSTYECIVIPTNALGVNGAGLAKQAAEKYPREMKLYTDACRCGYISGGSIRSIEMIPDKELTRYMRKDGNEVARKIICAATKQHWKNPSRYEYIEEIAWRLDREIEEKRIESIDIPKLGCGHGGLVVTNVIQILKSRIKKRPGVLIRIGGAL